MGSVSSDQGSYPMFAFSLARWLKMTGAGPGPRRVPQLEVLEGREVPSPCTVLHLADIGIGSLRQPVADANVHPGADAIAFAPGLHGTITLSGGQLTITDSLTVAGPGAEKLAVSGNDS